MKINIIAIGKLSKEFDVLFQKYKRKIEFYSELNIIEIKEVNNKNINLKINKETELILKAIPKNSKVIYCSIIGKQKTSLEFSHIINKDNITFVIGGSNGVNEERFKESINFSKMTFPHQMFRIMLVEQIFRGFSILNNSRYHK